MGGTPVQTEKEFKTMGGSRGGSLPEELHGKTQNSTNLQTVVGRIMAP